MNILAFSPKTTTEKITVAFNFATIGVMSPAESLSNQSLSIVTVKGIDPSPVSMLTAPIYPDPAHQHRVLQKIQGGINGCVYRLTAQVETNFGNIYEMTRLLKVEDPG
jgi:hypothetical protein